MTGETEEIFKN